MARGAICTRPNGRAGASAGTVPNSISRVGDPPTVHQGRTLGRLWRQLRGLSVSGADRFGDDSRLMRSVTPAYRENDYRDRNQKRQNQHASP
jgi:hypothetical protein